MDDTLTTTEHATYTHVRRVGMEVEDALLAGLDNAPHRLTGSLAEDYMNVVTAVNRLRLHVEHVLARHDALASVE